MPQPTIPTTLPIAVTQDQLAKATQRLEVAKAVYDRKAVKSRKTYEACIKQYKRFITKFFPEYIYKLKGFQDRYASEYGLIKYIGNGPVRAVCGRTLLYRAGQGAIDNDTPLIF